ncbi:fumarylacetoacetate hydrolase family protein [Streptomyces sp. GbtcB6]|uniref:fumarylacetoacetate hydrolase family protein n=1 Tax=Streptomyces sp. GbtcB6 TaxID=2824751 RepID=UPI001C308302|nr:fumarylacetoacetate hydrolase family protein [Streptomyces sp. GbtcB6]
MARKYLPTADKGASGLERPAGRTFPGFMPARLWYRQPVYYMSNALTIGPSGATIAAHDVQLAEMRGGFGPHGATHFASSMSSVLVAASEVPDGSALSTRVGVNGVMVARGSTSGMRHSAGEALAHAS